MKRNAYIFDIDGTLANGSHRQHWVKKKPKNWAAYNATMHLDSPIDAVVYTLLALSAAGNAIVLSSGRQDKDRKVTEDWMTKHGIPYDDLFMRKTNDYRDDTIAKAEMLPAILEKYNVIAIFDDRVKVVDMWRSKGYHVFDVNQTREDF